MNGDGEAPTTDSAGHVTNVGEFPSTSDQRVTNNAMRHQYRTLSPEEKASMQEIKDMGLAFWEKVNLLGNSRDTALAKTHIEDAVMRAVRHITG